MAQYCENIFHLLHLYTKNYWLNFNCWKLYRQFKTNNVYAKYKCAAKKCTLAVNDHLTIIENDLINKEFNGSNGIAPLKNSDGQLVYDNSSKAVLLNEYFSSVFTVDNGVIYDSRLPHTDVPNIPQIFCTSGTVFKYIKKLKFNSRAGPHGPAFIKVLALL